MLFDNLGRATSVSTRVRKHVQDLREAIFPQTTLRGSANLGSQHLLSHYGSEICSSSKMSASCSPFVGIVQLDILSHLRLLSSFFQLFDILFGCMCLRWLALCFVLLFALASSDISCRIRLLLSNGRALCSCLHLINKLSMCLMFSSLASLHMDSNTLTCHIQRVPFSDVR